MKAIQFSAPGAPLQLDTIPIPVPQKGEVLVKIHHASINAMDPKLQASNAFKLPLPAKLGYDVSGVVTQIGEGVSRFAVGDEVFGFATPQGGGFAQYIALNENLNLGKRHHLSSVDAGASGVAFGTAWVTLFTAEDLSNYDIHKRNQQGKTIFIPGGGGGVGHVVLQLAKKAGYKTITTGGKPTSLQFINEIGADHVIDYSKSNVVEEVLKITNNEGVDVSIDTALLKDTMLQCANVTKKGGKWICLTGTFDDRHTEAVEACKTRGVEAITGDLGRYWRKSEAEGKPHLDHMFHMCDELSKEGVKVRVTKVIPLELKAVQEEVAAVGKNERWGKVVIEVEGDK